MKTLNLIFLLLLAALGASARGDTRAELLTTVATELPTNGARSITAANIRTALNAIVNSAHVPETDGVSVVTSGSYANPSWLTSLHWSKITNTPTTLAGYGITDAIPLAQKGAAGGVARFETSLTPAVLWVDGTNGNDSTATRGRRDLPYATVVAAAAASQVGDTIHVYAGTYTCTSSVILKSGVTLRGEGPGTTIIRLGNAANTWLIRNANPDTSNSDITIRDICVDGNNTQQTAEWDFGQVIFLNGVTRARIENVRVKDPRRFGIHCPGATDSVIRDIVFDYNSGAHESGGYGPNMDGVHLNNPTRVLVENLYGNTYDDAVYVGVGEQASVAGLPDGPYAWKTGPADQVTVRNVHCPSGYQAVRIQDGNERGTQGCTNIVIDGVYGSYSLNAINLSTNGPLTNTKNITIRNVMCTAAEPIIDIDHKVEGVTLENWKFSDLSADQTIIYVSQAISGRGSGGELVDFVARDIYVDSGTHAVNLIEARFSTSKIVRANFERITIKSTSAGNTSKVIIADNSSQLTDLQFADCTIINQLRPWTLATPVGGEIRLNNCTIEGGSAASSYAVYYDGARNFGKLSMIGCRVSGYVAAYAFTATSGATQNFYERGSSFAITGGAEFPFPNGAAGSGTFRFNAEAARCDFLTKITPSAGDTARTTQSGFSTAALYRYNGNSWVSPLLVGYTVATLPTGALGMETYVTDAVSPTYLGTLTGGGSVRCPVFHNGTAWVSH